MRRGVLICVLAVLVLPASAQAAFPGQNGKMVFVDDRDGNWEIYTADPDGTDVTRLTFSSQPEYGPHWSPDGEKIAFLRGGPPSGGDIYVMNADGSAQTPLGICAAIGDCAVGEPAWAPDGSRITWGFDDHCWYGGIWVANADGTDPHIVHCPGDRAFSATAWSPDGKLIAHIGDVSNHQVYLVAPDGSSATRVTDGFDEYHSPDWHPNGTRLVVVFNDWSTDETFVVTMDPDGTDRAIVRTAPPFPTSDVVWSPDGQRMLFRSPGPPAGIWAMDADGTDPAFVTQGRSPDWQPIAINAYPRPKGAAPMRVSLVTAYDQCATPNRTHGPPLAFASCNPPAKTSAHLTVGTGDSNGKPARNEGYLRLATIVGNPGTPADEADVAIDFFSDDVFNADLTDYTGELRAELPLRITDRDNTPNPGGPGAATTQDFTFDVDATCVAVAAPQDGSSCQTTTTFEALVPGAIKEGRRSIWQLGQVVVNDGGPDGDASTVTGNTLFARQGVFIP